ncbi:MAG: rfbF, partial [Proteobacteria bacterium]|nr:rfbF [Pseudomonadota bacterium]
SQEARKDRDGHRGRAPGRFGALKIDRANSDLVSELVEKPAGDGGLINGGFFVLSPRVKDFIEEREDEIWEHGPLTRLAAAGELVAFRHPGFWHPMDTIRDRLELESLWNGPNPPWKNWQ